MLKCISCDLPLEIDSQSPGLVCPHCGKEYSQQEGFYRFIDASEDYRATTEDEERLLHEYTAGKKQVPRYFFPLFRSLGLDTGSRILSVGCGSGGDVEAFHNGNYRQAYGIEILWRSSWWKKRGFAPEHYFLADGCQMPFVDDYFDIVISLGVIEHIGAIGPSAQLYDDYEEKRLQFLREGLRVIRPGGYFIVACPNRTFPVDFQHGFSQSRLGKFILRKTGICFHSPFNRFLWSYGDLRRKISIISPKSTVKPLPFYNYLGLNFRNTPVLRWLAPLFKLSLWILDRSPRWIRESFLNPYMIAIIKK